MRPLWIPLAAVTLSACAFGDVSTVGDMMPNYRDNDLNLAAYHGQIPVIVQGRAFDAEAATVQQSVVTAMQDMSRVPEARFIGAPADIDHDYTVVWLFNGPTTVQSGQLCRDPASYGSASASSAAAAETHVLAAFCRDGQPLTEVVGRAVADSATDPNFARLLRSTSRELFPSRDNDVLRNNERFRPES